MGRVLRGKHVAHTPDRAQSPIRGATALDDDTNDIDAYRLARFAGSGRYGPRP